MEWTGPEADPFAMWLQLWIEEFVRFFAGSVIGILLGVTVIVLISAWAAARVRRRFWCRLAHRDVEVEFERRGLLRRYVSVTSCSAFEPATSISCGRRCLEADFRRQSDSASPLPATDGEAERPGSDVNAKRSAA